MRATHRQPLGHVCILGCLVLIDTVAGVCGVPFVAGNLLVAFAWLRYALLVITTL